MEIILNGERIPQQACEQEVQRVLREAPHLERPQAEARARESLIARGLLRQNAFNSGIGVTSEDVDAEYRRLVEGYGGEAQFYTQMGLSRKQHEKRLRRDIQERLRVDRFVADLTRDLPAPTEEAVEDYCREHPQEMVRSARVHASHIVRTPNGEAYRELLAARRRLLDGADFSQVARECSGCDDGGGDLGTFPPGRMVSEFDAVAFSMNPGEISPVFLTAIGYHIVKVWEREEERPMTHEEALSQGRSRLEARAREAALTSWLAAKRERAVIDVRP
jgi:parvulin-like peptidyl-prolyl isomerase